jgi:biopolymer transport protein ExbD/biopolymer transport protein TolR
MLVLLVIFMITAPILQTGIQVNLPHTRSVEPVTAQADIVIITIDSKSHIYLSTGRQGSHAPVNVNDLPTLLEQSLARSRERKVYVRGDGDTPYRTIAYVLGLCKQTQASVSLITELEESKP